MVFKRYLVMLVVRLLLVGFAMALVVWLLLKPGFHSSTLLSSIVLLLLVTELWRFVSRTNREVARFLDAVPCDLRTTRSDSISRTRAPVSRTSAGRSPKSWSS
jgi:membrane protein implicated in regulation of membrane protease activity